jgi:hypothetical protein
MQPALAPVVNFRTFHDVEVGVVDGDLDGQRGTWLVFPDGKHVRVRQRAYANLEEAMAAEVAVWRIRRIKAGIDQPTAPAPTKLDLFAEIRTEADSERVTVECGATGKFGARCYRQDGHEHGTTKHARAHIGRVTEGGPDAKFVDDGKADFEIWSKPLPPTPKVLH